MNPTQVENLVHNLMVKHDLIDYTFKWNNNKIYIGSCNTFQKIISISRKLLKLDEDKIKFVVLHEIAHVLCPGHKHDKVWKNKCRELGIEPIVKCHLEIK